MRENLLEILNNYLQAFNNNMHPIIKTIKEELPAELSGIISQPHRYKLKGSHGSGNWANIPWVAIFDLLVTDSAQSGFYPVYLFKDDMSGVYLSLNQGVTKIAEKYKRDTKYLLRIKAADYESQIENFIDFNTDKIILKTKATTNSRLPDLYEAGNIISKYYSKDNMPTENILRQDLLNMILIYNQIFRNDTIPINNAEQEEDENDYKGYENINIFRLHKRIERNYTLSTKVKKIQGYVCKACDKDFETMYGILGKNYIEAHHLKPLATLQGEKIELDARTDFTVLCSNCHRMIHRLDNPSDILRLREIIQINQN